MSKVIDRVRKLQQLATSDNENEASVAAELALRLMREHAITRADLDAAIAAVADPMESKQFALWGLQLVVVEDDNFLDLRKEHGRFPRATSVWKRALFSAVADYLGLRMTFVPNTPWMTFYGFRSDIEHGVKLYAACARQIERQALAFLEQKRETLDYFDAGTMKSLGASFRESAVSGLEAKFRALMRTSAQEHHEGHALVLGRKQAVDSWFDGSYSFGRSNKGMTPRGEHCGEGYAAGKHLSLVEDRAIDKRRDLP
jgi:hypothetical protein